MTHTTQSLRHAGTAIAAVLAIASTPSLAQDAAAPFPAAPEPVIVVPDISVPATPPPTVVLPTTLPEPAAAPANVQTPEPEAQSAPVATTTRSRVSPPAARAAAQPAPRAETAVPAAVEEAAPLAPVIPVAPVAVEPPAPVATTTPTRTTAGDDAGLLALGLGGLAFLALAIWGFIAIGRRKPVRRFAAEVGTTPVPAAPTPMVAEPAPLAVREPVAFAPRPAAASPATSLSHSAAVALPAHVPETYAERDALMKRMIAARPDRANPFTDRGARTKRARLILQSLGRDFGEAEPWIDLSQYPNNWPQLARKRSAAA